MGPDWKVKIMRTYSLNFRFERPNRTKVEEIYCFTCNKHFLRPKCYIGDRNMTSKRMKNNNPLCIPEINKKANQTKTKNNKLLNRKSWNYKDGLSRNRWYTLKSWIKIAKKIYARDNWECQICFKHGGILNAHHKDVNRNNNDEKNIITLCRRCHMMVHKKQGDMY